jgi:hypothetical protein
LLKRLFNYNSIKLSYDLFCNLHLLELHLSSVCFASGVNSRIATGGDDDVNESFGHDDYYNVYSDEDVDSKRWVPLSRVHTLRYVFPIWSSDRSCIDDICANFTGLDMKLGHILRTHATIYRKNSIKIIFI